ncbi:hypothetical protein FACS1894111_05150 [Clostridia bacterium]|nr:hypothetical protein FACS1894111_05150 [Clostridia bacterium]
MNKKQIAEELDRTATLLYQNSEEAGYGAFVALLPQIQSMGDAAMEKCAEDATASASVELFLKSLYGELVESYEAKDILLLADCLKYKASVLLEFV